MSSFIERDERKAWQDTQMELFGQKVMRSAGTTQVLSTMFWGGEEPQPPSGNMVAFVEGSFFSFVCALLILSNTAFIGVETDWAHKAALSREEQPEIFETINRVFKVLFSLELALRLATYRTWWFLGPDWKWNLFDALLVLVSLMQEVTAGVNVSFMRIFRVFRIVRVARVIRVVRVFRELRRMALAIMSCLASLSWAFLLLILIMFVFSIFFVQGATGELRDNPQSPLRQELVEWYPSLFGTMFSLLLCISGGSDWWTILAPLAKVSVVYRWGFAFYIVFVTFGVLNVLTGVFLENALEFSDKDLVIQAQMFRNNSFIQEMSAFFKEFDTEHSGSINWERFQAFVAEEEVYAYLASHQLESQDAYSLFKLLDHNEEGTIDTAEFVHGCLKLKGEARCMDVAVLLRQQELQGHAVHDLSISLGQILAELRSLKGPVSDEPSPSA